MQSVRCPGSPTHIAGRHTRSPAECRAVCRPLELTVRGMEDGGGRESPGEPKIPVPLLGVWLCNLFPFSVGSLGRWWITPQDDVTFDSKWILKMELKMELTLS